MELQFPVRCPHCKTQQAHTLEGKSSEVDCVSEPCAKPFYILETNDEIVLSLFDADSEQKVKNLQESVSGSDCPNCGKKLVLINYFKNIRKTVCGSCYHVVLVNEGANAFEFSRPDDNIKTIFNMEPDPDPGT